MPFVTEYNTNLILKKLIGEIPDNIRDWDPYKKPIYFLNRLDKTHLLYYKKFCENPVENIDSIYVPITVVDNQEFVYEGASPSYHKHRNCDRLSSNFINYRIPSEIKERGEKDIERYRIWFKENAKIFLEKPDLYQARLLTEFQVYEAIQKVDYKNSGNVYKENLTLIEIETRIDSLLHNASQYYHEKVERQSTIKSYGSITYQYKSDKLINKTAYSDEELREIMREYHFLFHQPIMFYLKEFFQTFFNADIEFNEVILEQLNFQKCGYCFSENYESDSHRLGEKLKALQERFGENEFPIEPTVFHFKDVPNTNDRVTFIYCRVYRQVDFEFHEDVDGRFQRFRVEFINHENKFLYSDSKIYESETPSIQLFRKYITKIEQNKATRKTVFTTYAHEI